MPPTAVLRHLPTSITAPRSPRPRTLTRPTILRRPVRVLAPTSATPATQITTPATTTTTATRTMSTSSTEIPTFGFTERQPSAEEKSLVDDVLHLYQLNPISAAYARYAPTATFHDPIGLAQGLDAVKAQFNGMPKIFSSSVTKGVKYLDNPDIKPPSVQISLSQLYTLKSPQTDKLVNSLVTFHVDPSTNLITQHDEEWDGKKNTTSEDGFFGALNEYRKKATAKIVHAGVDTTPKDQA